MKALIEAGHVYVAQPPLYSTLVGNSKVYLKDDVERARFLAEHPNHTQGVPAPEGPRGDGLHRAPGHHDRSESAVLLQVTMEQASIADDICSILMGDDVEVRRTFIQTHAKDVRFLDI